MNKWPSIIEDLAIAIAVALAVMFAIDAFAQTCTTYYDQNTGKFCRVCPGPGGVGTVVCY